MRAFDCDAAYGRGAKALPREIETMSDLLAELDHSGIQEALVWHRDAWERGFEAGNQRMVEVRSVARLHATWTFVPPCCPEMHSAVDFIQEMRVQGVRAVRAFPIRHCYCLDPVSCGPLLELFAAYSIPLLIPLSEVSQRWHGVYALMRDFPRLTLILTETGCWGEDRYFRPLMKTYPRFHISTNRFETAGQLKSLVNALGPTRLLFGSGLPRNYPGGYLMMVARADISDEDKEAILHGNVERLLKEVPW